MKNLIKTITIEKLAETMNGQVWTKGDLKRIYLNDKGYNTKKMSTKTHVFQRKDGTFGVSCTIDCPSQHDSWIESQQNEIVESITRVIDSAIEEHGVEVVNPQIEILAKLDAEVQVQGYYMRWHEVRVAINSYGKLADRKRQRVHTYTGAPSVAPAGFIELNDGDFMIAIQLEKKQTNYEYGSEPTLVGAAKRMDDAKAEQDRLNTQMAAERALAIQKKNENDLKRNAEIEEKLNAFETTADNVALIEWAKSGFIHPSPSDVLKAKESSGLNWKKFQSALERMIIRGGNDILTA